MAVTGYICLSTVLNKDNIATDYVVFVRADNGPPAWCYRTVEQGPPTQDSDLTAADTVGDAEAAAANWAASIGGHLGGWGCPER